MRQTGESLALYGRLFKGDTNPKLKGNTALYGRAGKYFLEDADALERRAMDKNARADAHLPTKPKKTS